MNNFVYTYTYDAIHRPLQSKVLINAVSYLAAYNMYGENISINDVADMANNLRGQLYRQFDQSGLVTHYLYDFKGQPGAKQPDLCQCFYGDESVAPAVPWTGAGSDISLLGVKNI